MTTAPYELPDRDAPEPLETPGMVGFPGEPTSGPEPEPVMPEGLTDEAVKLVTAIGQHERELFERTLVARDQHIEEVLQERLEVLHDPMAVMFRGILVGAAAVIGALVLLVVIGLLFLYGLSLFRA